MKSCQTNRFYSRFSISCLLLWATMLCAAPWPVAEPESVGFQKDKLEKVAEYAKENTGTTGLVVVVNGKIIYTYGDIKQVSYTASCRKSVLSMLYGKYVVNGTIKLDETIGQLGIDDVQGLLPQEKEATVYDLITARSGVYHPASNPGGIPEDKKYERGVTKHGTRFVYNNWDFNVAGTVFTLKTGLDIYDALEQDLAKPLGMEDFDRARHKLSGNAEMSKHLAYYMHFSTRDMARIGQLMLQKGRWNGEQLVPEEWGVRSTSVVTPLNREFHCGYGILWWLLRDKQYPEQFKGAYSAQGMYGQFITVFPAMNMVVAHKSAGNAKKKTTGGQYRHILRLIVEASLPKAEEPSVPKAEKAVPKAAETAVPKAEKVVPKAEE